MSVRALSRGNLRRGQWAISVAAALAVVGFVAAAQWNSSIARQQFTSSAQQVLTAQADALQREQESLRSQIEQEERALTQFQEQQTGAASALERLNRQVADARLAAGLTPSEGSGVVVEISDSQRPVPQGENPANYIVLVDDLRDIVTALWASGAEGITINDERLVATSSIYGVGASILVNTAFLSPPFRVEAIGPDDLHERFLLHPAFISRVGQRIDAYGLAFASEPRREVRLEGFIGNTAMGWGVPVDE
jgi:uncharacterized protein YlxW (UPF0749 family)